MTARTTVISSVPCVKHNFVSATKRAITLFAVRNAEVNLTKNMTAVFNTISNKIHTVFIFRLFNIGVLRKTDPQPSEYNCSTLLNTGLFRDS